MQNPETAKPLEEELNEELFIGDLFEAIATGHIEDLIKRGVDLNKKYYIEKCFSERRLLLNYACENARYKDIELLVKHGGVDLDKEDFRCTPLRIACVSCVLDIAKFLIDRGTDVNKTGHKFGFFDYPLHASVYGTKRVCSELVEYLLKHGADVNVKNADGAPFRGG